MKVLIVPRCAMFFSDDRVFESNNDVVAESLGENCDVKYSALGCGDDDEFDSIDDVVAEKCDESFDSAALCHVI